MSPPSETQLISMVDPLIVASWYESDEFEFDCFQSPARLGGRVGVGLLVDEVSLAELPAGLPPRLPTT